MSDLRKRTGRFVMNIGAMLDSGDIGIVSKFVIADARFDIIQRRVVCTGFSPLFDIAKEGMMPPWYSIQMVDDRVQVSRCDDQWESANPKVTG